jgi:polysaccharide biosynthesis/export protein
MSNRYSHRYFQVAIIFLALTMASCIPQKKIRYFQDKEKLDSTKTVYENEKSADYEVQVGDQIYITVNAIDKESYSFGKKDDYSNYYTEAGIYLNSYSVNDSGYIEFPLIGRFYCKDKTIQKIKDEVQKKVDEYIKNTTVIVKLASFRISMVGEFKHPGRYLVYQDKLTLFEGISMAGDLTDFARRSHATLIRETKTGFRQYRIDLTDQNIIQSDLYYLMPNDLLYVEPVRAKQFTFAEFPYSLIFATITTTLLLIEYLK